MLLQLYYAFGVVFHFYAVACKVRRRTGAIKHLVVVGFDVKGRYGRVMANLFGQKLIPPALIDELKCLPQQCVKRFACSILVHGVS